MHSIPAISEECEWVLSSASQLLTKQQNQLLDDIAEANECLLSWRRADMFRLARLSIMGIRVTAFPKRNLIEKTACRINIPA